MDGLLSFQEALLNQKIKPRPCLWNKNLHVLEDDAEGELRVTHARIVGEEARGYVVYCIAKPVDSVPCFAVAYAVAEAHRHQGLGTSLLIESIEELGHELQKVGITDYYLEAVVSVDNEPSNKMASKVLSSTPVRTTDIISGEPAFQYLKRFKTV